MTWQSKIPKQGTEPEEQLWGILGEMKFEGTIKGFDYNTDLQTPFRDYPIQADVIVDDVLVIEVQGEYWHSKKTRHRKDQHKLECFEMIGYGVLWLYDDELNKATIPKYRETWRPSVKRWIISAKMNAERLNFEYNFYQKTIKPYLIAKSIHPDLGIVSLRGEDRRL